MKRTDIYLVRGRNCINGSFIKYQVTYSGDGSIINPVKYYRYNRGVVIYITGAARNKVVEEYLVINGSRKATIPVVKCGGRQPASRSSVGVVCTARCKGNVGRSRSR
jgi:hypothetical protein